MGGVGSGRRKQGFQARFQIGAVVEEPLYISLIRIAEAEDRSISSLIRRAVREFVEREHGKRKD